MIRSSLESLKSVDWGRFLRRRFLEKFFLLALLSLIIGYLLSPKLFNRQESYREGDVIRQNIVVQKDMMIEDVLSTKLKQQQLLNEQGQIFDYDPSISNLIVSRIKSAFQLARDKFADIKAELNQREESNRSIGIEYFNLNEELHVIQAKINIFEINHRKIQNRLSDLKQNIELSSKNFQLKNQLDWELNTYKHILQTLSRRKEQVQKKIKDLGEELELITQNQKDYFSAIEDKKRQAIIEIFKALLVAPDEIDRSLLNFEFYSKEIEFQVSNLVKKLLSQKIFVNKKTFLNDTINFEIQNVKTGESFKIDNLDGYKDLDEIYSELELTTSELFPKETHNTKRDFIRWLVKTQIYPTITENKLALEKKKDKLKTEMNKVFYSVKKGQVIARAGERVDKTQVQLIKGYLDTLKLNQNIPRLFGVILIAFCSLSLIYIAVVKKSAEKSYSFKKLILMGTTIIITMAITKVGIEIKELIELRYIDFNSEFYNYVFPVTLSAMLVGILINFEIGVMSGLLTSLFISIMMKDNFYYFYFSMMGCIIAAMPIPKFDSRYSLLQHGLKISLINVLMVLLLLLINENQIDTNTGLALLMAFIGGIVTAIITSILLPFYESIFDITTSIKLLELSNMNHPLLKELIFKAPGTYQHSIVVGNLAESGADKIGANSLLARVSSYYHDIGKGVDPHYFIENQPASSKNIHDNMDPYESAKIIFNHLIKGREKAEKHNLGKDIIDILRQHHGTGLMKIFHQKALVQAKDSVNKIEVREADFRYPGPKPQTLEAALVMIADITEASTRSLNNPTPDSIKNMVHKVGWGLLESGQLDESGITLNQFKMILDQYCSVLTSIHHHRIKYPGQGSK